MTQEQLNVMLELHKKWLNNEKDGVEAILKNEDLEGMDFSHKDLRELCFSGSNLTGANFEGANLCRAEFREANLTKAFFNNTNLKLTVLYNANLENADLSYEDLSRTHISGANLRKAKLKSSVLVNADLSDTDLSGANLRDANLRGASLRYTNLTDANLKNANLCYVNLSDANLSGADLTDAILDSIQYDERSAFLKIQCPEEGAFIGFKKCGNYIVKLQITEDALRSSSTSRKCRCSKAKVLSIENLDGTSADITSVASTFDCNFFYTVGKIVEVKDFDTNRWDECSTGIHFFITKQEAINY